MNLRNGSRDLKIYLEEWHRMRHLARTDLLWLCTEVLGNTLISERVHGPIIEALQQFPGAHEFHKTVEDIQAAQAGKVLWEPLVAMELLPCTPSVLQTMKVWWESKGKTAEEAMQLAAEEVMRQVIVLFPRGHAKSTLATVAHSIQWILNYPNVRIFITTATEDLVTKFILEIRGHFEKNEMLRHLFPEICQPMIDGKVPDLGNMSGFTIRCRDNANKKLGPGGKDPTVWAGTVGKAATGGHPDVEKMDDLVEKINSSSQAGIDATIQHFGALGDLLEKYVTPAGPRPGWTDVIGTPWDFSDLYQVVRTDHEDRVRKGEKPVWDVVIRSAAPNWPEGPFLWPEKMGYAELKKIEDDPTKGTGQLSAQYLMNPIAVGQGLIDNVKNIRWMPELEMQRVIPGLTLAARMDLAGMDSNAKGLDNDYTVISAGGFREGTLYVPFIRHGRPATEEAVEWIFELFQQFPQTVQLQVEKASGASSVESWLIREMSARNKWLPVTFVGRSNQQSKVNRIKGLRPWFQRGQIIFSDGIPYRTALESEIKGFPKFRHDDILDTLSDLMTDVHGTVTSGVISDQVPDFQSKMNRDPISLILQEHEQGEWQFPKFNSYTGWPA